MTSLMAGSLAVSMRRQVCRICATREPLTGRTARAAVRTVVYHACTPPSFPLPGRASADVSNRNRVLVCFRLDEGHHRRDLDGNSRGPGWLDGETMTACKMSIYTISRSVARSVITHQLHGETTKILYSTSRTNCRRSPHCVVGRCGGSLQRWLLLLLGDIHITWCCMMQTICPRSFVLSSLQR